MKREKIGESLDGIIFHVVRLISRVVKLGVSKSANIMPGYLRVWNIDNDYFLSVAILAQVFLAKGLSLQSFASFHESGMQGTLATAVVGVIG